VEVRKCYSYQNLLLAGGKRNERGTAQKANCVIERNISMNKKLPLKNTGTWIFDLQQERTLQFRITSEQGTDGHILIEGHDISVLLDYLYDHREFIYEATHDQARQRLEAADTHDSRVVRQLVERRVEPTLYFDDGTQRTRADL
jgi:hypothetical protein